MCHPFTCFPSSSFILFSSSIAKQNQGANIPILLLSPPPRKVSKMQTTLISSPTRRLPLHILAESFLEKGGHPRAPPPHPVQSQGRHIVILRLGTSSHPSLHSFKQHYVLWTKSHSSAPCSKCLLVSDGDKS